MGSGPRPLRLVQAWPWWLGFWVSSEPLPWQRLCLLCPVLQGVDNSLVGLHNQSFARVMEQRLAQLFMMSQQQGRRFKRATTLGSYTVQVGACKAARVYKKGMETCFLSWSRLCCVPRCVHTTSWWGRLIHTALTFVGFVVIIIDIVKEGESCSPDCLTLDCKGKQVSEDMLPTRAYLFNKALLVSVSSPTTCSGGWMRSQFPGLSAPRLWSAETPISLPKMGFCWPCHVCFNKQSPLHL